jgi:hypothetical protein
MDKKFFAFIKNAYLNGLCDEYKDEIRRCGEDKALLMSLALRQQSLPWVISNLNNSGVLDKSYMLENFGECVNTRVFNDCDGVTGFKYKMFVGYNHSVRLDDIDVSAYLWCDKTQVDVVVSKCPTLYIGCGSTLHLTCDGYNSVRVYLFDHSRLVLDDVDDTSMVTVLKYSESAEVEMGRYCLSKKVKVFNKELNL